MSNSFPNPNDGSGEWNQYARLILHQLQQLSDGYEGIRKDFAEMLRKQDLDRAAILQLRTDMSRQFGEHAETFTTFRTAINLRFDDKDKGVIPRIELLEDNDTIASAFKRGRWWVISGAFVILTAIVLPTISLIWK